MRRFATRFLVLNALFLIAFSSGLMPAIGQNLPEKAVSPDSAGLLEQAERARIADERASQQQAYEAQRQACYQKLAVTSCLTQARDAHNERMRDLKRQEVNLDDALRKRKAAERLRAIDERNSPQAQLEQAERRGRAMEQARQREANHLEKQRERDARQAEAAAKSKASSEPAAPQTAPVPKSKVGEPAQSQQPPVPRPDQTSKSAKNRQAASQREKEAQERRAKAEQREAQRKKPPAASLPVPP